MYRKLSKSVVAWRRWHEWSTEKTVVLRAECAARPELWREQHFSVLFQGFISSRIASSPPLAVPPFHPALYTVNRKWSHSGKLTIPDLVPSASPRNDEQVRRLPKSVKRHNDQHGTVLLLGDRHRWWGMGQGSRDVRSNSRSTSGSGRPHRSRHCLAATGYIRSRCPGCMRGAAPLVTGLICLLCAP